MNLHGAVQDFDGNKMRYYERMQLVVDPFRTDTGCDGERKLAPVRRAHRSKFKLRTVTPVEIVVTAPDGVTGIFVPMDSSNLVMLAATVTTTHEGKV